MPDDRLDPDRWVRLQAGATSNPDLRWLIRGNAHTFRGRFHVCAEGVDQHRTVDLGDVAEVSPVARIWLDGFLAGQEIAMSEFLGGSEELAEAEGDEPEAFERWERYNADLRHSGFAGPLDSLPPDDLALNDLPAPSPWAYVGGLYRIWVGSAWVGADPQPVSIHRGAFWPGTICAARRHCSIAWAGDYGYCEDCHHVTT